MQIKQGVHQRIIRMNNSKGALAQMPEDVELLKHLSRIET